jgi:hypothetical protein
VVSGVVDCGWVTSSGLECLPLEPSLDTASDGTHTDRESHTQNNKVGSRDESVLPNTWTESGQTPILQGSL